MFSFFAVIFLLNAVLALPSPRPIQIIDDLVSVSDIRRINATEGMRRTLEVRA